MLPPRVGPYTVVESLGSGGFGHAYLALDQYGSKVAVKVLKDDIDSDLRADERFERELEAGRRLRSQYYARVLDWDLEARPPWIAFAYAEGRDLRTVLRDAPLEQRRALLIVQQLTEALREMGLHGLVHRDLKPENIQLGPNDAVTVLDLGIASAPGRESFNHSGSGTMRYMAPEQVDGAAPTPAMDMWAVGLITAELAGGRHPFGYAFGSTGGLLDAIRTESPDLSRLHGAWHRLVEACLAHDPGTRPTPEQLELAVTHMATAADALDRALATAAAIEDARSRAVVLADIGGAQEGAGDPAAALATLATAWEAAAAIDNARSRAVALERIAWAQAGAGDPAAALATLAAAREIAAAIDNARDREGVLERIAEAQAGAGDPAAALATLAAASEAAAAIDNARSRTEMLERIAQSQAGAGDPAASLATAAAIDDTAARAEVLVGIAKAVLAGGLGRAATA